MPRCIVCREYFDLGTVCTRCQSDNARWIAWQKNEPVEQGGLRGLFLFTEQYFHLPLLVIFTSLALGLMATAGIWRVIRLPICLFAITATTLVNLLIVYGVYQGRHRARERELLGQFRATLRKKGPWVWLSSQLQTLLIPVIVVGLILLLTYALMQSELLQALVRWLLFEPTQAPLTAKQAARLSDLKERAEQALPVVTLVAYITGSIALTYFSSVLVAQQYTGRMNEALPDPIFLQGDLLMQVVHSEVEKQLCQPGRSPSNNREPLQPWRNLEQESMKDIRRWNWETLERTPAGGIKVIARAECADSRVEESITGHRTKYPEFIEYSVEADPWGHVIRITQGERRSQY
jgi:predicted nucleic acid-binding protein